ncbi:MAG TPA: carbonic anhydrase [Armatimonadota bacterium]|nr:carbonic anhydrase [Armatimonadota bacterium]
MAPLSRIQMGIPRARVLAGLFAGLLLLLSVAFAFGVTPKDALALLADGNARFVQGKSTHPNGSKTRLVETAAGQHPFAVVLTCADSRVSPELIFDRGIGDLFVVRTAGNVIDPVVIGSIEYAVEHLHAPRIIVMGHTRCGAVQAAAEQAHAEGSIGVVVACITPAVEQTAKLTPKPADDAFLDAVSEANARQQAALLLRRSPLIAEAARGGTVVVSCAMYDVRTGVVTLSRTPVAVPDAR